MTPEERISQLKSFLEIDPKDSFTRFAIAQEYQKLGNWDEVLKGYESIVADNPEYVGVYYHLGKLYQKIDQSEKAKATLAAGIQVAESQADLHAKSELQSALMEIEIGFDD